MATVKNIARVSSSLEANVRIGGYPDLLPRGRYTSSLMLKCDEGIEVKASVQEGGWQGHNPEDCWVMVFRYAVGKQGGAEIVPLTFLEILAASRLTR